MHFNEGIYTDASGQVSCMQCCAVLCCVHAYLRIRIITVTFLKRFSQHRYITVQQIRTSFCCVLYSLHAIQIVCSVCTTLNALV
jgi:hypothetical protein